MPIYEYQCEKCGTFEMTQRITEKPLSKCPTCKSRVKKLISNTSFQLKGTGWYITDYARKDKSATKSDNGTAKSTSETKKETKTEAPKSGEKSSSTSSSPSAS
jgi:putative FmdB family regulatory protein